MSLQIVWPTRSRSGSQFAVKLTRSLFGSKIAPVHLINGARRDTTEGEHTIGSFSEMFHNGSGIQYIRNNGVRALKYEDPGKDDFVVELMQEYPNAKAIASYRSIEKILISHFNIKRWGHSEADVLHQFSSCLPLYRTLFEAGRLYLLDVDSPQNFDLNAFASFLGVQPSSAAQAIVAEWQPTNTLEYQQEKHDGGTHGRALPPRIDRLREIHSWIDEVERGYRAMCNIAPQNIPPTH